MVQLSQSRIKVGIVGGTGYTGVELLRLLSLHPNVELTAITSRKENKLPVTSLYQNLRGHINLAFSLIDEAHLDRCDVVFFATPHGVAMKQAPALIRAGVKIIDLAADFRMADNAIFEKWYKMPHACPGLLTDVSAYGLVETNRTAIRQAKIIGNPGCYPTTVILGVAPLLQGQQKLIDLQTLVADCKSGISGAGRQAETAPLFSEAADNVRAYSVADHRHHPEIVAQLQHLAGESVCLTFVPHLVPMIRGMFSTLYARVFPHARTTDFQALFEMYYKDEPFVDVLPAGSYPETRSVRGSNQLRISVHCPKGADVLVILVVQDNLVKGASGQAVQNMNVLFGLPETTGLLYPALLP